MTKRFSLPHMLPAALVAALACAPAAAMAQGAPEGAALFKQQCQMCHVSGKDARPVAAPNLYGVVGRKAASTGFAAYSPALKASGLTWTSANLDRFLTAPARMVPGTRMVISIPDAARRAAVIAYLKGLK